MLSRTALSVDEKSLPLYSDIKELEGIRQIYQHNASVWDNWAKHLKEGGKVVGTLANSPIELLRAAGVFSVIYKRREDLNRAIIKGDHGLKKWIYHFGIGECVCRYVNGSAGSPILGACPGYDTVITDFHPKMPEWGHMVDAIGSKWDFHPLEIPDGLDRKAREDAIYERLLGLKVKLEALTGEKLTDENLRRSIDLTNEVTDVFSSIDSLIKAEPHPLKSFDIYNMKVICTDYIGGITEELLGALYLLEDELKERVANGIGYDGHTLLLAGGFRNEFLHAIDSSGGIVTAAWPFQRFTAHRNRIDTTGDPYMALARWYAGQSGIGSPKEDAKDFTDLVAHYGVDGVIYHKQCPFGTAGTYTSYGAIKDAVDAPFLTIEAEEEDPEGIIKGFLKEL